MPRQERQTSYDSLDSRSTYSRPEQDEYDDSAIGDTEDPPASTSDNDIVTPEASSGTVQPPAKNDSDNVKSLFDEINEIRRHIEVKMYHAARIALILERSDDVNDVLLGLEEKLAGTEEQLDFYMAKADRYEGEIQNLMKANKDLVIEKETLEQHQRDMKAKTKDLEKWKESHKNLTNERNDLKEQLEVLRARAKELFN
jgi:chromosome segregation ATPase